MRSQLTIKDALTLWVSARRSLVLPSNQSAAVPTISYVIGERRRHTNHVTLTTWRSLSLSDLQPVSSST